MKLMQKILPVIVLVIAGVAVYFGITSTDTQVAEAAVEETSVVAAVEPAAVEAAPNSSVIATGIVAPIDSRSLVFARGGRVVELAVAEGDQVEVGDVIARLDSAEISTHQAAAVIAQQQAATALALAEQSVTLAQQDIQLLNAQLVIAKEGLIAPQSDLVAANAQLEAMVANSEGQWRSSSQEVALEAEFTAARAGIKARESAVTQASNGVSSAEIALLQADTRLAQSDLRVEQANTAVEQAAAALDQFEIALAQTVLTAPIAGTIAQLNLHIGDSVIPNSPVMLIADFSQWTVVTSDLTQFNVVELQHGMTAMVSVDALPDSSLNGTVSSIGQLASTSFGDVVYPVTIALSDTADATLYWGLEATVEIELE